MKNKRLTKEQLDGFMKAAEHTFHAAYDINESPYSCHAFISLSTVSSAAAVLARYKSYLAKPDIKNGVYIDETGDDNFTLLDGFSYLTAEQRQLSRSLMILMVMEAES